MTKRVIGKDSTEVEAPQEAPGTPSSLSMGEQLREWLEPTRRPYQSEDADGVKVGGYYVPRKQAEATLAREERLKAEANAAEEAARQKELEREQARYSMRKNSLMREAEAKRALDQLKDRERDYFARFVEAAATFKDRRLALKQEKENANLLSEVGDLRGALREAVALVHNLYVASRQVQHGTNIWKLHALQADNAISDTPDILLEKKLESAIATGYQLGQEIIPRPNQLLADEGLPVNPECSLEELVDDGSVAEILRRLLQPVGVGR